MSSWQLHSSECLSEVRKRASRFITIRLQDVDALTIALISAMLESHDLLEYAYEGTVRLDAISNTNHICCSTHEFAALFGASVLGAHGVASAKLRAVYARPETKKAMSKIESALQTTLTERAQSALWKKSMSTRAAAYIALFRPTDSVECLSAVVGGLVHADLRLLDDLRQTIEDDGIDIMLVHELVRGLVVSLLGGG